MFEKFFPNAVLLGSDFWTATLESIQMTLIPGVIAGIIGLLLGIILLITDEYGLTPNRYIYWILDKIVNIGRSIPFIILLAVIMPFTRLIVGTSIGTAAVTVPLVIGTTPFFARQIQNALLEVDPGVVEAAKAMGSSNTDIILRVYLKEGLVSIIRASSFTVINLIGLTAMAGAVGGGGLGAMALQQGYQRGRGDVTFLSLVLVLVIVFITQIIGNFLAKIAGRGLAR
ncbi:MULTISPECIES: methionine ABC transporter permease [unclassified Enterococcus]|uniref:methionine ABC transporter permease n=1 Tax=unclassified Enterococcus TaxID=2608891 RepID=UPI00155426CB|nr:MULTISPECIES: methionine ABC transporter permease [unclassified Enterococcus]MBS7577079.1 ABC transporter permease [Enterococcus sp. MMGLQ5-2]MBS7584474.1 ABC transporter permease [Enterococcus sp. MMGLQ5-1]NPD12329.1 ABC transporter permease [Enterococcus sp. MMGLQ5-1]NPD36913.1 ABC transporter permease [Enterococcus sp. MMGLQ5-2]